MAKIKVDKLENYNPIYKKPLQEEENDNKWDTGELGRSEEHAIPTCVSKEEQDKIDKSLGLTKLEIRIPIELLDHLNNLASKKGIKLFNLIRQHLLILN